MILHNFEIWKMPDGTLKVRADEFDNNIEDIPPQESSGGD